MTTRRLAGECEQDEAGGDGRRQQRKALVQTGINALTASLLAPRLWDSTLTMALAMLVFLLLGIGALAFMRSGENRAQGRT